MLELRRANRADLEQEFRFVRDMPEDENGFTNPWHDVSREVFERETLPEYLDFAQGRNLPEGFVPETFFFLWDDGQIVGQFRLRHHLCESLRTGGGHIGYLIGKAFRGRGYGTDGLALTLAEARRIIPEDEVYLRVNRDNPASLRVMLKNHGYIHHEDADKIYVRIPKTAIPK